LLGSKKRISLPATELFMAVRKPSAFCKKRFATSPPGISTVTDLEVERPMKSPVVKRSIVIAGHKTSVSLEDAFWKGLKEIADAREMTLSELVASIDTDRKHGNLSSAIRLFVLDHFRSQLTPKENRRDPTPARAAS
jgi:predicted DNA-binding ribbon-helix-helix protein